jgi:hypothetical protein
MFGTSCADIRRAPATFVKKIERVVGSEKLDESQRLKGGTFSGTVRANEKQQLLRELNLNRTKGLIPLDPGASKLEDSNLL